MIIRRAYVHFRYIRYFAAAFIAFAATSADARGDWETTAGRSLGEMIRGQLKEGARIDTANAANGSIPSYDVDANCDAIARVGGSKSQRLFNTCIDQEQKAYDGLKTQWSKFPGDARAHCDAIAQVGGAGSYRLLATCLKHEQEAGAAPRRFKP